jgi:uncharacterized membrane protein
MPTTAWRFAGTEAADGAVLKLKALDSQDLINVQDVSIIRWPEYAGQPTVYDHVTEQGGMVSALMRKVRHEVIDDSMIETVKTDLTPGTSAVVLLSTGAVIDEVARALQGSGMELIRSDLSVPDQDRLRAMIRQAQQDPG